MPLRRGGKAEVNGTPDDCMASIGQTLCQIGKDHADQALANTFPAHDGKMASQTVRKRQIREFLSPVGDKHVTVLEKTVMKQRPKAVAQQRLSFRAIPAMVTNPKRCRL